MRDDLMDAFNSLLPGKSSVQGADRRTALRVALGMGYAAAAMPIAAQTAVTTSSEGLVSGMQQMDVDGFSVPMYYAAPAGKKNLPVILVVQEIFGLHAYIADVCRRLAQAGYLAVAPDLFARQGDASQYTDIGKLLAELVSKVPDAQVLKDLDAAVAWAGAHGGDSKKVGITGFCWGGRITWLYAQQRKTVKAGVAWYGRLVGKASPLTPYHPVDLATTLHAPVLGLYAGQDSGIPLTTVNEMKDALAAAGAKGNAAARASQFKVFQEAGHAFHADYRPSYRKEAAQEGWAHMLAWFRSNGLK